MKMKQLNNGGKTNGKNPRPLSKGSCQNKSNNFPKQWLVNYGLTW